MRASRLLTIQMLLQTHGRMSAQTLADTLEISLRTLYRDVDQLTAAGVPIYAERGRLGGFQLMPGWNTTLTGFTATEAQAVFMSGLAGPAAQLGLGQDVSAAQLKLMTALPAAQRGDAQRIQTRFHLDPVAWYREQDDVPHLATVSAAVWNDQQLLLRYESWNAVTVRTVNPLGLVLKAGLWYLVATAEGKTRTYRVAKIQDVSRLESRAERPKKFDLAAYWAESLARFENELYQGQATVLATRQGLSELRQLSAAVAKAVAKVPTPDEGQRARLKIPIESHAHAAGQLLLLAPEVEVAGPKALLAAMQARLRLLAELYPVAG
jgi:predicted DNA-binding transcriptional regulator YafY